LPAQWALLGGLFAIARIGTFSYWANGYGDGPVAAMGGALVLGALPRIKQHQRVLDAMLMGVGIALLAHTRPYEGLFFASPIMFAVLVWIFGADGTPLGRKVVRTALPLILVLLSAFMFMGYYFWRTTGSPFNTPYLVNVKSYCLVPNFPWS